MSSIGGAGSGNGYRRAYIISFELNDCFGSGFSYGFGNGHNCRYDTRGNLYSSGNGPAIVGPHLLNARVAQYKAVDNTPALLLVMHRLNGE